MYGKHIALIHTGGTIGMEKTANGYAPIRAFADRLTDVLATAAKAGCALPDFTVHQFPAPIDSANATPADWQSIGRDIAARYSSDDGFVVLHGTDTMAYTASALSFMLQGLRKPVIMTGAQIPLGESGSDALHNLTSALQLATSDDINEVAIFFGRHLLRGNRCSKRSAQDLDAFESPNYPALAETGIGNGTRVHASVLLARARQEKFELPEYDSSRTAILSMRVTPGLPAAALPAMLALRPRALILECYGAGNAPDNDLAMLAALRRAHTDGVLVLACSQAAHARVNLNAYATGSALADAGVIGALDMTFEASYAKLHHLFALGLPPDRVREALLRDLSGELTP